MKDEKMKDREMWMDKLKEKLENYSEPIPPFGWEQLEKELVPPVKKRILYPYRRWGAAAAAVLLVVASSLSIYFLNTPTADEIRHTVAPVLASDPDLLPPAHDPDMQVAKVEPVQPRPVIAQARKVTEREGIEPSVPAETVTCPVEEGVNPIRRLFRMKRKRLKKNQVQSCVLINVRGKINCIFRQRNPKQRKGVGLWGRLSGMVAVPLSPVTGQ